MHSTPHSIDREMINTIAAGRVRAGTRLVEAAGNAQVSLRRGRFVSTLYSEVGQAALQARRAFETGIVGSLAIVEPDTFDPPGTIRHGPAPNLEAASIRWQL